MCGRMFQTLPLGRLLQIARTTRVSNEEKHTASFNVCPTAYIPVIRRSPIYEDKEEEAVAEQPEQPEQEGEEQNKDIPSREVTFMKWGHQTKFNMLINGRIEEMTGKRTFLHLIENRCVVIMEGYYQWQQKKQQKEKQPFCFKSKTSDHFLVAGLYSPNGEIIILTKDAIPSISHIHERMPVILSQREVELWLDPKNTKDINKIINNSLLNKEKAVWKNIGFAEVAPYVNKLNEKSAKCLMSLQDYKKELDKKGIMRFLKKPAVEKVGKDGQILQDKSTSGKKQEELVRKNVMEQKVAEEKIQQRQDEQ